MNYVSGLPQSGSTRISKQLHGVCEGIQSVRRGDGRTGPFDGGQAKRPEGRKEESPNGGGKTSIRTVDHDVAYI